MIYRKSKEYLQISGNFLQWLDTRKINNIMLLMAGKEISEKPTEPYLPYLVTERPDFGPTQVKDPAKLRIGEKYLWHRAVRCVELGHEYPFGREYEAPLEIEIRSVNLKKPDKLFDFLTELELEVDGQSIIFELGVMADGGADGIYKFSTVQQSISLARAGLGTDKYGFWHKYNWIEDSSKKSVYSIS